MIRENNIKSLELPLLQSLIGSIKETDRYYFTISDNTPNYIRIMKCESISNIDSNIFHSLFKQRCKNKIMLDVEFNKFREKL